MKKINDIMYLIEITLEESLNAKVIKNFNEFEIIFENGKKFNISISEKK